ncbi:MAG: adenine phosphoribosyltransferase [Naasia sp.]|uniref:adenine phosphoribosyltransferase n=1 Tax=Naasia sp. TaxID=2546198 RepID=UPI002627F6F1|nr:adenine phosphoribosyltransferase [Naasia sp.]MCU1571327.1 adenine phosphoribosyltransferase [Naasia sp.]
MTGIARLVQAHVSHTPDFPELGVLFRDLSALFADPVAFRATIDAMSAPFAGRFDVVAGAEARGFLFAAGIGYATGTGVLPLRKPGKLPPPVRTEVYALEYGTAELQIREGTVSGARVLLVDDVLATGGTLRAARRLLEKAGNTVVGASVVLELADLGGRAALQGFEVSALLTEAG